MGHVSVRYYRLWWIEEIDDSILAERLKALSEEDLALLTFCVIGGYSQLEVAKRQGGRATILHSGSDIG